MTAVFLQFFKEALKENELSNSQLMEMSAEVAVNKKIIKIIVRGEEISLNRSLLKKIAKRSMGDNNKLFKIFKVANGKNCIRYSPFFLNEDAANFFLSIKEVIGKFEDEYIIDKLQTLIKYRLTEQSIVDRIISLYIKNSEIYKNASQNKIRVKEGKTASRHYVAPDELMFKYLSPSLEGIVENARNNTSKGTPLPSDKINFKNGEETLENLLDFKLYNAGSIRKGMTDKETKKEQTDMIRKPNNDKVFKEYIKLLWKARVKAAINEDSYIPTDTYINSAVEISKMEFTSKDGSKYTLGPYTSNQIEELEVNKEDDSVRLAIRAIIDTEKAYTKRLKEMS